jgi:hypothetical protein
MVLSEVMLPLLRSVRYGWGYRDPGGILGLLDDIMRDMLARFPTLPMAGHIREVVEIVIVQDVRG